MDPEVVDRFRNARFNLVKRGYDRGEVDRFLNQWADWMESLEEDPSTADLVKEELERIGERTSGVLTAAGEAAAKLTEDAEEKASDVREEAKVAANITRMEADRYADEVRGEADDYAQRTRGQADAYATERRTEADEVAEQARADAEMSAGERMHAAKAEAESLVEEGRRKRADLEKVIADLTERRDALLDEIESIAGALTGTASQHRQPRPEPETSVIEEGTESDNGTGPDDATREVATAENVDSRKSSAGEN